MIFVSDTDIYVNRRYMKCYRLV